MSGADFFRAFLRDPKQVGSVWPSSPALGRAMVQASEIGPDDVVVELGAGTGPVTRELVAAHGELPLLVLEPDEALAARCRELVPGAEVLAAYAQELPQLLQERGLGQVTRIVSSLPWTVWPAELQDEIFDALFSVCSPDARMVTFSYWHMKSLPGGRRIRSLLESRFPSVRTTPVVWNNLPPAFVYVCDRGGLSSG